MTRKYLSCAETAKLVRQALKESFPGVTFGVRSKTYSGGASITVHWIDGPTSGQVDAVAKRFEGASFDGMIDLKSYHDGMLDGQRVHFGADYVFTERKHSAEAMRRALDIIGAKWGIDTKGVGLKVWEDGSAHIDGSDIRVANAGEYLTTLLHREIARRTRIAGPQPSATLARLDVKPAAPKSAAVVVPFHERA